MSRTPEQILEDKKASVEYFERNETSHMVKIVREEIALIESLQQQVAETTSDAPIEQPAAQVNGPHEFVYCCCGECTLGDSPLQKRIDDATAELRTLNQQQAEEIERLKSLSVCEACCEIPAVGEYVKQMEQQITELEAAGSSGRDEALLRACYDYIKSLKLETMDVFRGIGVFGELRERVAPQDIPPAPESNIGLCCYGGIKSKADCASCAAWEPVTLSGAAQPQTNKGGDEHE